MSPMLPLFVLLLLPSLPLVTCEDDPTMQTLMALVQQQAATIQTLQATVASLQNGAQQSLATQQTLQTTVASLENSVQQSHATQQTVQTLLTTVASLESSAQQSLAIQQTLQTKMTSLESGEQTLQARMTSVEHGAQQSLATQQTLQATVASLQNGAQQSLATQQTLQATVASLQNGAQQSQATQQTLQTKVTSLENSAHQLLATEQQHTGQINAINTRLNTQVYFNAYMVHGLVDVGTNNAPMKFDGVINNVGNGYNPQTGVFTAPVTGTYVMYTQLMKQDPHHYIAYEIYKSETRLCASVLVPEINQDKSSCLASVHLQKGETVIVRRTGGTGQHLEGYANCAFSGFLLSADAS